MFGKNLCNNSTIAKLNVITLGHFNLINKNNRNQFTVKIQQANFPCNRAYSKHLKVIILYD